VLDRGAGEALLLKLDEFAAELSRFRAELVALMPPAATNGAGSEGADDFEEHNVVSVQAASERWHVPQDTLRHWARHEAGLGIRTGNVWRISVPALRRRLARRAE
jgi:hypothetical protein